VFSQLNPNTVSPRPDYESVRRPSIGIRIFRAANFWRASLGLVGVALTDYTATPARPEPIIDVHQRRTPNRPDEVLLTPTDDGGDKNILLPWPAPKSAATHEANG
jgi:hypothetical protein